jgi:hypothetical protein
MHHKSPPMTRNMRANGVRTLGVWCAAAATIA